MLPDFMLLTVCGMRGLGHVGRQHLAVALALEVPLLVAVTKADITEQSALNTLTTETR
jgi:GTPase